MTGYELTRQDVENIALTKHGVEELKAGIDRLEKLIEKQCDHCDGRMKEVDQRMDKIEQKQTYQNGYTTGMTKKEVIGYSSIPSVIVGGAIAAWEFLKYLSGGGG